MNSWLDFFVAGLATQLQEVRSKGEVAIRADVLAADKGLNERQAELVGAFFGRGGADVGRRGEALPRRHPTHHPA